MMWIISIFSLITLFGFFGYVFRNDYAVRRIRYSAPLIIIAVLTFAMSLTIVESGKIKTLTEFGIATNQDLTEGVYMIAPWKKSVEYSSRRDTVEQSNSTNNPLITLSKDPTDIQVDYVQPYQIKPGHLGKVFSLIGGPETFKNDVMVKASKSSVRNASPNFTWKEAGATKQKEFAQAIQDSFERKVKTILLKSGFKKNEIEDVVEFHPVDLRRARPIRDTIVNAVADKLAELEELEKQKTVSLKAKEIANRRKDEGKGLANLFKELPKGYTPNEVAMVLHGMADKTRADSLDKLISMDKGDINLIAIPSTNSIAIGGK